MEILDNNEQTNLRFHYNLKTLRNITLISTAAAIIVMLLRIFAVIKFQALYNGAKTDFSKYGDLVWYGQYVDQLSVMVLAISVLGWIPFFMWLYRAYYNLDVVKLRGLNVVPGWAVGWFFIPFANLYYSVIVINDLFRGTKHLAQGGDVKQGFESSPTVPWGILWLLLRGLAGILSYFGLIRVIQGNLAVFDSACFFEILSYVFNILSGIIIIYLVYWVSKKQEEISQTDSIK